MSKLRIVLSTLLLAVSLAITLYAQTTPNCKECKYIVNTWFCMNLEGSGGGSGWDWCHIYTDRIYGPQCDHEGANPIESCPAS